VISSARRVVTCVGVALVTLVGPVAARAQPATGSHLTLEQAVSEALEKNNRLLDQRDTVTQADLGVRLARNTFQPKVTPNVLGSFGQTNVTSQTYRVDVSQRFVTGTELRLGVGTATSQIPSLPGTVGGDIRFYNADTTLTLSQPLLKGLGREIARRGLTSAEVQHDETIRQQTQAEQQVAIDVASAYYRVIAQQSYVGVTRQSVDRARRLREAAEAKLDVGLVSQLDLLRAQQLVTQAESQLFDAQSTTEDAREQLLFLIGRNPGASTEIDADIPAPEQNPIDSDRAISMALANRLDLKGRAAAASEADHRLHYSRNQLLPQVDVNLALTRRTTSDSLSRSFGLEGYQFATFFTIAMPVDRTAQLVDYQSARIDDQRRRRELTLAERQVADDVRRAVRERDRLFRSVTATETSVTLAKQEVEIARFRSERGLSNNLDVVNAESGLLAAESRRIQALADAAVARLRLRAVLGVLDPRADMSASVTTSSATP
jgi:outer membrane protein